MNDDPILAHHMKKRADRHAKLISTKLQRIAKMIDRELANLQLPGEDPALFSLLVYTGGAVQYIGNGDRADTKRLMASVVARWEFDEQLHKPMHTKTDEQIQAEKDNPL